MPNNIKTNKKPLNILLISYGYDNLFQKSPLDYIAKLERDRLEPQSNSFFQFTWSSKSYYEERNDRLRSAHVKTVFKNFKPMTDFLAIFMVTWHIKKRDFKPDVVLIYDLGFVPAARLIKYIYGCKIVLGLLNMPSVYSAVRKYGLVKSWYSALLEKLFLRPVDAYYTINKAMESYLIKLGAPLGKIKIFSSNTIARDQSHIALSRPGRIRLKYNIKDEQKIILSIGRLEAEKGYHELLELFSQLDKKFILIILGRGSFLEELTALAEKLHISDRVIFAGYASRQEIWDYYKDADLFILLSKVEALGLVFWEAMYMRVPVIGSLATGIAETIGPDGARGLIYDRSKNNIDDLKAKINFCLLDSEPKKIMLDQARKYVEERIANDLTINDIV